MLNTKTVLLFFEGQMSVRVNRGQILETQDFSRREAYTDPIFVM